MADSKSKLATYAVVGNPISHSLSPQIHAAFAAQTGVALRYEKLLSPLDAFTDTVEQFFQNAGSGLNITVPFKDQAYAWVDRVEGDAKVARAVNTIVAKNGEFVGYNTDGLGLVNDLARLEIDLAGRRVLMLGAGGAVSGVLPALLRQNPQQLVVANRTLGKAEQLVERLNDERLRAVELSAIEGGFEVIINATSAGLAGDDLALPSNLLAHAECYDMIYGAGARFFQRASTQGRRAFDGLGMLVEQAAQAFYLWTNVRPDTRSVLEGLIKEGKK